MLFVKYFPRIIRSRKCSHRWRAHAVAAHMNLLRLDERLAAAGCNGRRRLIQRLADAATEFSLHECRDQAVVLAAGTGCLQRVADVPRVTVAA